MSQPQQQQQNLPTKEQLELLKKQVKESQERSKETV
jgi:hypothetical protein